MSLSQDSEQFWREQYEVHGAYWESDHNPLRPHVVLTSGLHSDCFFNSEQVMQDPILMDDAAHTLTVLLMERGFRLDDVDRVVGPAMGAITQAHDVARRIGRERGRTCLRAYVQKKNDEPDTPMIFDRTKIESGERILLVEDVVSKGISAERAAEAIIENGGILLPYLAVLVNRSGLRTIGGMEIVALITTDASIWTPDECPLCKAGSEPLPKAKKPEHWARLNAQY